MADRGSATGSGAKKMVFFGSIASSTRLESCSRNKHPAFASTLRVVFPLLHTSRLSSSIIHTANSGQKGNRFSGADGSHLSTRRGVRFFPSFFPGTRSVSAVIRRLAPMPPEKWYLRSPGAAPGRCCWQPDNETLHHRKAVTPMRTDSGA
jgi:hypothetical protein